MMKSKENRAFVPLTEAQNERIAMVVRFPYIDNEQIEIALPMIEKLMRFAGIRYLYVVGSKGETSKVDVEIVGFDSEGGAYAGGSKTKMEPANNIFQRRVEEHSISLLPPLQSTDAVIDMNLSEIGQRIRHGDWERGVRSPEAWTYFLNQGLQEGIREAGMRNLMAVEAFYKGLFWGLHAVWLVTVPIDGLEWMDLGAFVLSNQMHNIFAALITLAAKSRGVDVSGLRWSLSMGPQWDRALVIAGATRALTLARVSPER